MATLLRKLCESATLKRTGSNSNPNPSSERAPSPLGAFDPLPADILMQIVRLLGPRHAARLSLLSKSWRSLVSDNDLWAHFLHTHHPHSAFFAETALSSGYPLPTLAAQSSPRVSLQHVYALRERLPPSVVIDGSGFWLLQIRLEQRRFSFRAIRDLFGDVFHVLILCFERMMQVKPSSQPAVVSIPICHYDDTESAKASRQQLKEAIYAALFDMNVPAVCALNQKLSGAVVSNGSGDKGCASTFAVTLLLYGAHASSFCTNECALHPPFNLTNHSGVVQDQIHGTLALYAAEQTSGIAVNIGFQVTSVVPSKVMRKVGVEVVGLGALKLTGFLRKQMQENNISFESLYTVRTLKEKLCYVAVDYEAELLKDTQASFEAVEGLFTLSKERFQTGEILFQPRLAGVRAMGLQQAIALCMEHCYSAELAGNNDWYKTVVLSGGTACLPGLAERLEKELHSSLPPYISDGIRVIPPPFGADTAWFGGKILGSLSTFPGPWCTTKKQFRQKSKINRIW
ncbi:unnamed protein product [Sphenostylis stenocarpa]|uniref:F-box domain-containing protein n=1 Tax=Sphenostylis stenocarpa TaxID=92480 RepID=A0AA86S7P9_9FABA|nr:unnamed protein product [Sphenostylis stenocarpa]